MGLRAKKLNAIRLLLQHGYRHHEVHRNQQIALVLMRCNKSWNSKLAKDLILKY